MDVVLVFNGTRDGALKWMDIMAPMPLPVLLDPLRQYYTMIGHKVSLKDAWNTKAIAKQAKHKYSGKTMHSSFWSGVEEPVLIGGNFLVDKDGKLALVHPSKNPFDRPSVKDMIDVCK